MSELIIKEDYIMFETAKLAKEKGFGWKHRIFTSRRTGELVDQKSELFPQVTIQPGVIASSHVEYCFDEDGKVISPKLFNLKNSHYPRPTQALLAKWLREIHNIFVCVNYYAPDTNMFNYRIDYSEINLNYHTPKEHWKKHEDAFEAGLVEALKLIS